MHKQFKVPLDGLIAEEITVEDSKKAIVKPKRNLATLLVEAEDSESSDDNNEEGEAAAPNTAGGEKALKKKLLKEEKREKRRQKKELKLAFSTQNIKLLKQTTAVIGGIRAGVSVKKIY